MSGVDASNFINPAAMIGAPDGPYATTNVNNVASSATATFAAGATTTEESASLAGLLGVAESVLMDADFVAFEAQGGTGFAWESSTFIFTDGSSSLTEARNINAPTLGNGVVAYGTISRAAYEAYWGVTLDPSFPGLNEVAYVLFDLGAEGIDVNAAAFQMTLNAGGPGFNTPDPESFAILGPLAAVPEPSTLALLGAALCGLAYFRRRR